MKEPLETVTGAGHRLGEYIRDQRHGNQISLRQLAALAGVSNPYLSQIERGLRRPSAEILQQIAKGLRISAEALYLQAGILEHREGDRVVADAVLADEALTERQKQVLLEIYDSFRRENAAGASPSDPAPPAPGATPADVPAPAGASAPAPAPRRKRASTPRTSTARTSTARTSTTPADPTDQTPTQEATP